MKLDLPSPIGFKAGGIHCGIKKHAKDLALIYSEVPAVATGLFTTNQVQAAPIKLTKNVVSGGTIQAIIINSGNANCVTGPQGERDALEMARFTAQCLDIDIAKVAVASTGLIGKPLPIRSIVTGIEKLVTKINPTSFGDAALAILTTDKVPKTISRTLKLRDSKITITAIAKGAGMIYPKLALASEGHATMLCFITTDLNITQPLLQQLLERSVDQSFNCISVDGCTSTNDMVLAMANGMAQNPIISEPCPELDQLQEEFNLITRTLAQMIVKDSEGATKLIKIQVKGAPSPPEARSVAFSVANSNLLKSSFSGETLNWGRIISAIGSSGINLNPGNINIHLGNIPLVTDGNPAQFSLTETLHILKQKEITVIIELNQGQAQTTVWTSDLSPKYVRINMR